MFTVNKRVVLEEHPPGRSSEVEWAPKAPNFLCFGLIEIKGTGEVINFFFLNKLLSWTKLEESGYFAFLMFSPEIGRNCQTCSKLCIRTFFLGRRVFLFPFLC